MKIKITQSKPFLQKIRLILYYKLPSISYDSIAIPVAWYLAYWFRFNMGTIDSKFLYDTLLPLSLVAVIQICVYLVFRLDRSTWKFSSITDIIKIIKGILVALAITIPALHFTGYLSAIPRSIIPLYFILLTSILCGGRLLLRWYKQTRASQLPHRQNVLIVGAGQVGESLVRDLLRGAPNYNPIGFVDDKNSKQGIEIHGIRVLGKIRDIADIVAQKNVDLIFIAIPSARSSSMRRIVSYCEAAKVPVRTLPSLQDLASGRVDITALREISLEDLLGRDQVSLEWEKINNLVCNKRVLITGGGGSIGSELSRQLAKLNPQSLYIVDNSELNLYHIEYELKQQYPKLNLHISLNNVVDSVMMHNLMQSFKPDIVFHAAAFKHVPLLQNQILAAIKNNIIGTQVVAQAAVAANAKQFILISTDKAVNPTNLMGATKRAAEIYCQNYNLEVATNFITVRFGNVLGSTGSVVPLFKKQLAQGGPITITHPDISRYFMSISEASILILQAASLGKGGEIFVLDMGEPIKIKYLAEQMIRLAGKKPNVDIKIHYIGLRPGEKLYEELFYESEQLTQTEHEKILTAKHQALDWNYLSELFNKLHFALEKNEETELVNLLKELVPEYEEKLAELLNGHSWIMEEPVTSFI